MSIKINWEAARGSMNSKSGKKFKDYAGAGIYTVTLDHVDFNTVGPNNSIAQEFFFAEDDVKYPKASHWLSFNNDNWRYWHNKCLFEAFGLSESDAKKFVEFCEDGKDKEAITRNYKNVYAKVAAKHPTVEIEVWPKGKYMEADFTSRKIRCNYPKKDEAVEEASDDDFSNLSDEISEATDGAVELSTEEISGLPF